MKGKKRKGGGVCVCVCVWCEQRHENWLLQMSRLLSLSPALLSHAHFPIDTNTVALLEERERCWQVTSPPVDAGKHTTSLLDRCCRLWEASGEWNSVLHLCLCERGNCVQCVTSDNMMELLTVFALCCIADQWWQGWTNTAVFDVSYVYGHITHHLSVCELKLWVF